MTKLKEMFPNHKLGDKYDYELQQFTADDMVEFAEEVAKEALKNASNINNLSVVIYNTVEDNMCLGSFEIAQDVSESILNENNIPRL